MSCMSWVSKAERGCGAVQEVVGSHSRRQSWAGQLGQRERVLGEGGVMGGSWGMFSQAVGEGGLSGGRKKRVG